MIPSLSRLAKNKTRENDGTTSTTFDDLPESIVTLIVEALANMGCHDMTYPAMCSTSALFRQICMDETLWQQRCVAKGWTSGAYARPSPMRSWFAHYMIHYCGPYAGNVDRMLEDAAGRGDVQRVAAALASGANPTKAERPLRYAVATFSPNVTEYAMNKGDMVGVVALLLQYGPPPAYAMKQALTSTLVDNRIDPDEGGEGREYRMLYNKYVAAPSFIVASILLDYISATQYRISGGFYQDMVRAIVRQEPFAQERLRLLVSKRPFLVDADYTYQGENVPYHITIASYELKRRTRYEIVRTLLELQFPTTWPTHNRYATIVAAIHSECEILGLLLDHGATFPRLDEVEVMELLKTIGMTLGDRENQYEEEDEEEDEEWCDMASYLRERGLI